MSVVAVVEPPSLDVAAFIRMRLRLGAVPRLPPLRLYTAHAASGLSYVAPCDAPPYWAYLWAGGLALAHHFAACPEVVRGRRMLDLGAGSGIVALAAAQAGARAIVAAETDTNGAAAIAVNAEVNGVHVDIVTRDLLGGPPPAVDVVAVGDLFYGQDLATRVLAFLRRCQEAGLDILIGDPGRSALPVRHLQRLATYDVTDFGRSSQDAGMSGKVFGLLSPSASRP